MVGPRVLSSRNVPGTGTIHFGKKGYTPVTEVLTRCLFCHPCDGSLEYGYTISRSTRTGTYRIADLSYLTRMLWQLASDFDPRDTSYIGPLDVIHRFQAQYHVDCLMDIVMNV